MDLIDISIVKMSAQCWIYTTQCILNPNFTLIFDFLNYKSGTMMTLAMENVFYLVRSPTDGWARCAEQPPNNHFCDYGLNLAIYRTISEEPNMVDNATISKETFHFILINMAMFVVRSIEGCSSGQKESGQGRAWSVDSRRSATAGEWHVQTLQEKLSLAQVRRSFTWV